MRGYVEGKVAEAEALFARFEKDYPESPWLPEAQFGRAATLEAQNKTAEALAEFEKLHKLYPNDAFASEVQLGMARLYERQDKPEQAYEIYKSMLSAGNAAYTSSGAEANARQEALLRKHPDLAKTTNAPAISNAALTNLLKTATNIQIKPSTNRALISPTTNLLKGTNVKAPTLPATNGAGTNVNMLSVPPLKPLATNALKSILTNVPKAAVTNAGSPAKTPAPSNAPAPAAK